MDYYKQQQVMLYAVEYYPQINRSKLMNVIFFADLFAYCKRKTPFLEDVYIKTSNGMIPKYASEETFIPESSGKIYKPQMIITKKECDNDEFIYEFKNRDVADLSVFTRVEVVMLNYIIRKIECYKTSVFTRMIREYAFYKSSSIGNEHFLCNLFLTDEEMDKLESFFGFKMVVYPVVTTFYKIKKFFRKQPKPEYVLINGFPKEIPVILDGETGNVVEDGFIYYNTIGYF